jgi:hypothetical protein
MRMRMRMSCHGHVIAEQVGALPALLKRAARIGPGQRTGSMVEAELAAAGEGVRRDWGFRPVNLKSIDEAATSLQVGRPRRVRGLGLTAYGWEPKAGARTAGLRRAMLCGGSWASCLQCGTGATSEYQAGLGDIGGHGVAVRWEGWPPDLWLGALGRVA